MLRLKLIEHGKIKICIHKQTCNILFIIIIDIEEIPGQQFLNQSFIP